MVVGAVAGMVGRAVMADRMPRVAGRGIGRRLRLDTDEPVAM
jgi:hypothetical protein